MRVLVVEDDPLLGRGVQAGLEQTGFAPDWVRDGVTAATSLASTRYAAVVLDLGLLQRNIAEVQKMLDHKLLNKIEALGAPTLENLSRFVWERVQHAGRITRVSIHRDSCDESCTYYGPQG